MNPVGRNVGHAPDDTGRGEVLGGVCIRSPPPLHVDILRDEVTEADAQAMPSDLGIDAHANVDAGSLSVEVADLSEDLLHDGEDRRLLR